MDRELLKNWKAVQVQLQLHRQNLRWNARVQNKEVAAHLYQASNRLDQAFRAIDRAILEASAEES